MSDFTVPKTSLDKPMAGRGQTESTHLGLNVFLELSQEIIEAARKISCESCRTHQRSEKPIALAKLHIEISRDHKVTAQAVYLAMKPFP